MPKKQAVKTPYPVTAKATAYLEKAGINVKINPFKSMLDYLGEYEHGVAETEDIAAGVSLRQVAAVVIDLAEYMHADMQSMLT